jgi:hypothetical protein
MASGGGEEGDDAPINIMRPPCWRGQAGRRRTRAAQKIRWDCRAVEGSVVLNWVVANFVLQPF